MMSDDDEHERDALLRLEAVVQELAVNGNMSQGVRRELQRGLQEIEDVRPQLPTVQETDRVGLSRGDVDRAGVFWLEWLLEEDDFSREQLHTLLAKLMNRVGDSRAKPF